MMIDDVRVELVVVGMLVAIGAISTITWIMSNVSAWFFKYRHNCCNPKCKHSPDNPNYRPPGSSAVGRRSAEPVDRRWRDA